MDGLKERADFLRAARGIRRVFPALTLETCPTPEPRPGTVRLGFTATKKLGNAVTRNRAKRRLRAAAKAVLPLYGEEGNDYVLVARPGTLTRDFDGILADLAGALKAAHLLRGQTRKAEGKP